ncbi:hypothetical protein [Pontixanthobacter sp.]|uniref:hypothetical protein n=1 Tax=Pontixanthobacter sp. TaxID=2792078 RepID=UPI003C7D4943
MRAPHAIVLVLLVAACRNHEAPGPDNGNPQTADTGHAVSLSQASTAERENRAGALPVSSGGAAPPKPGARAGQLAPVCGADEQVIFACTMKSGKKASVCVADKGGTPFAQYRFGPADKPAELAWPMSPTDGRLAFKSVPYSGGGEAQISFTRGDTRYVVFSRVVRTNFTAGEPNYPAIDDGIMVLRGGSALGALMCADVAMPIQTALAEKYSDPAADMFYAE